MDHMQREVHISVDVLLVVFTPGVKKLVISAMLVYMSLTYKVMIK